MDESATPETDRAASSYGDGYQIVPADFARPLERRLSLAQTEIVKLSTKRSDEMLERGSLHMTQMREKLVEAQSRIAELEKLLGRWLTGPHVINAPLSLINETKYAALKDRA